MQKIKVLPVFLTRISLVTHGFHGGGPDSEESVKVTVEEAGNPAIRWLPGTQRSREIDNYLPCRHEVFLCKPSNVLYKPCLIA